VTRRCRPPAGPRFRARGSALAGARARAGAPPAAHATRARAAPPPAHPREQRGLLANIGLGGAEPLPWRATALAIGLATEGWVAAALWRWLTHD
jgi:hypothetical protein